MYKQTMANEIKVLTKQRRNFERFLVALIPRNDAIDMNAPYISRLVLIKFTLGSVTPSSSLTFVGLISSSCSLRSKFKPEVMTKTPIT